jgi:uncharacterized protein YndB with AHSA1/START domain
MEMALTREKYSVEYHIKSSIKILFSRLSTPQGLSEWFADEVDAENDIYTFRWNTHSQKARILNSKDSHFVRFQWIDHESPSDENFFEFKVSQDDLTGDVHLTITDFALIEEIQENKELWDTQINDLKRLLGS